MNITIKNVAEKAGISIATVSFVINNNNKRVSVETKNRILKTIKPFYYYPSKSARNLVSKKNELYRIYSYRRFNYANKI